MGSLLWVTGLMFIGWAYGRVPQEADLIEVLGLALTIAGYTHFRPSAPVPRVKKKK